MRSQKVRGDDAGIAHLGDNMVEPIENISLLQEIRKDSGQGLDKMNFSSTLTT